MDYSKYQSLGGKMSEEEYSSLFPYVYDFIRLYAESYIASWRLAESLEEYGDFDKAVVLQLDFMASIGGVSVFNGVSDLDIKSAETKGFKYDVDSHVERFDGIPLSSMSKREVLKELRKNKYLSRQINA